VPLINAKYQLRKNLFVWCQLELTTHSETSITTYVGVKGPGDTKLPIGTTLFFDPVALSNEIKPSSSSYDFVVAKVVAHEDVPGKKAPLHQCSLTHQSRQNTRNLTRKPCQFSMTSGNLQLLVTNGSVEGLNLMLKAETMLSSMTQGRQYPLTANFKNQNYTFNVVVQHIHYNWQTFHHQVGVQLLPLSKEEETVMNMLIDPNFKVELKTAAVDAASGKISAG